MKHHPHLHIQDLEVSLDAEAGLVRAIDGMRLTLTRGQTFALVGESGCGKSMTAMALMRLLPESGRIANGSIDLGGVDLAGLPESAMRGIRGARLGMIFQEPGTALNPVMPIGAQLLEAIHAHTDLRGMAARERAVQWLHKVGIPEPERRMEEYPHRLSGGQKQRVLIAMALACEPDFLIADEPTTALDVTIQAQILDLLKQLQRDEGMGILLITHDLAVVSGMAHHVALMYAGQIIESAPARDFFTSPQHPYAKALMAALPDARRKGQALTAIAGTVPPLWQSFHACRFAPRCQRAQDICRASLPELTATSQGLVRCFLADGSAGTVEIVAAEESAAPAALAGDSVSGNRSDAGLPTLLRVQNLKVEFPIRRGLLQRVQGSFVAVDDISFEVPKGRTVALVGESGCGKTTTGKAIVQLLRQQAIISGRADLDGQNLFAMEGESLLDMRRKVQIIFQDPFGSLNPRMRVKDILEEGMLALCPQWDLAARQQRLLQLLDQVGLRRDALERWPHEFSGGQRQRIAIARALSVEPRLIVCDEPTSALDVSVQAQILNLLRDLQVGLGVAYLFITHNMGVVEYLADDMVVMNRGRVEESGPAQEVLAQPQSAYTRRLLDAVPRIASFS